MGQQNRSDMDIAILLIVGLAIAGFYFGRLYVMNHYHDEIMTVYGYIITAELSVTALVLPSYEAVLREWRLMDPTTLSWEQFARMTAFSGQWVKILYAVVLAAVGWRVFRGSGMEKYRRNLSLEDLIKEHAKLYPVLAPIIVDNPMTDKNARWLPSMQVQDWMAVNRIPMEVLGRNPVQARHFLEELGLETDLLFDLDDTGETFLLKEGSGASTHWRVDTDRTRDVLMARFGLSLEEDQPNASETVAFAGWILSQRAAFARQLRRPWGQSKDLPPHIQGLLALILLHGARLRDQHLRLVNDLALTWADEARRTPKGYVDMDQAIRNNRGLWRRIQAVLKDDAPGIVGAARPAAWKVALFGVLKALWVTRALTTRYEADRRTVQEIEGRLREIGGCQHVLKSLASQHYFTETLMITLLLWARKRAGILASSKFVWLRPTNRGLWYVLNNVGRSVFHVEAAGVFAHWKVEVTAKEPIMTPKVEEAVIGLHTEFLSADQNDGRGSDDLRFFPQDLAASWRKAW
jgi:hypothetical protein